MTFKAEALLSDKFVEMSEKVKSLFDEKKRLTDEFKKAAEKYKADVAAIDKEAEEAHQEFAQWQEAQAAAKAHKQDAAPQGKGVKVTG
jgi:uncharacterized coiled-coil DUF342 family protein